MVLHQHGLCRSFDHSGTGTDRMLIDNGRLKRRCQKGFTVVKLSQSSSLLLAIIFTKLALPKAIDPPSFSILQLSALEKTSYF